MKSVILALTLTLVSANAFAAAKLCDGANNDFNTKGVQINADVSQKTLTVEDGDNAGSYPITKGTVDGKDGKTYLVYDYQGSEGCNEILVDENLLKTKGQGWIKFRCRGEGFSDAKFFCNPK